MGWKWEEDDDDGAPSLANRNPRISTEDRCSTRKIVRSSCRTEEVEPGRFVRKCDKTEQILRDCVGRPTEMVESKNEHTEEDVTDEVTNGKHPFELEPFSFPGLRSDMESIERSLSGGLGHFIEAAEQMAQEMAQGFFHSLNIPSHHNGESSSETRQMDEPSAYDGLPGEITDV